MRNFGVYWDMILVVLCYYFVYGKEMVFCILEIVFFFVCKFKVYCRNLLCGKDKKIIKVFYKEVMFLNLWLEKNVLVVFCLI